MKKAKRLSTWAYGSGTNDAASRSNVKAEAEAKAPKAALLYGSGSGRGRRKNIESGSESGVKKNYF